MITRLRNITIIKGFIILSLIAILVTVGVGVFGYIDVKKVNSNIDTMYNERVEPLGIGAGIRGVDLGQYIGHILILKLSF